MQYNKNIIERRISEFKGIVLNLSLQYLNLSLDMNSTRRRKEDAKEEGSG